MKKRTLTLVISLLLVALVAVGGTLAWLMDETTEVKNTFTAGNVSIDLYEHDANNNVVKERNDYKMVPGDVLAKDPTVTVKAGSEDCYLYIEVMKSDNLNTYISYEIDNKFWTKLTTVTGRDIYYYSGNETNIVSAPAEFPVLTGNDENPDGIVTVNESVTKAQMEKIDGVPYVNENGETVEDDAAPTLTFKAYAIQADNVNGVEDGWNKLNN